MSIFDFLTLFGGLAMFLYGMRLMGDGLKESSSGTLKKAMESVTNNPIKAFLLGFGITAIIQSSTATIVITSGLVGAGLLTLHQSIGIIVGANVGTTVTGQIIRLLDLDTGGARRRERRYYRHGPDHSSSGPGHGRGDLLAAAVQALLSGSDRADHRYHPDHERQVQELEIPR